MDELAHRMVVAREGLRAEALPEAWVDRAATEFKRRRERRTRVRRLRWAAVGLVAALGIGAGAERWRGAADHPSVAALHDAAPTLGAPATVRFSDGSSATPFDDFTVLRAAESTAARSVVELVRGGARFKVERGPGRVFRVEAGPAVIEVPGTEFTVERIASQVRVAVFSGELRVLCQGRVVQLFEGETAMFPRAFGREAAADEGSARALVTDKVDSPIEAEVHARPTSAEGLLMRADAARRAHRPGRAVAPLRKMIDDYRDDPRTPAAAFTLGRVLMDVGEYRPAALAFSKAAVLDVGGSLREDALAREVEAWSQAGDVDRAHARAAEYVHRYPAGAHLGSMKKHAAADASR
jgi:transmembrane sensor